MSYSVSVKFKNEQERLHMESFLSNNSSILDELNKTDPMGFDMTIWKGEDLPYAPKKKFLIGFHGSGIPRHIWDLCSWMAVKSTYRNGKDEIFFYYDDEPMLITFDKDNKGNTIVDQDGIRIETKKTGVLKAISSVLNMGIDTKKQKELLTQLNNHWNHYQLNLIAKNNNTSKNKP